MKILIIIVAFLFIVAVAPLLVMWLWNGMLPDMFGFPEIGFWRACGLIILSSLLFRGFTYKSGN